MKRDKWILAAIATIAILLFFAYRRTRKQLLGMYTGAVADPSTDPTLMRQLLAMNPGLA